MNCRYCGASGAEVGVGDDGLCIDAYKCEERHDLQEPCRITPDGWCATHSTTGRPVYHNQEPAVES